MPPLRAVLFDMDGTLVDSERQTDAAIAEVMARRGVPGVALPPEQTRGRSWLDTSRALGAIHVEAGDPTSLADELLAVWSELAHDAEPLPGVREAVREAARHLAIAVVSSSPRAAIVSVLARLDLTSHVRCLVGADDVTRHKPEPDCWLQAARLLAVEPGACLVIEDASAGLRGARAAGMRCLGVLHASAERERCRQLADACFEHYAALPASFWRVLADDATAALGALRGS